MVFTGIVTVGGDVLGNDVCFGLALAAGLRHTGSNVIDVVLLGFFRHFHHLFVYSISYHNQE